MCPSCRCAAGAPQGCARRFSGGCALHNSAALKNFSTIVASALSAAALSLWQAPSASDGCGSTIPRACPARIAPAFPASRPLPPAAGVLAPLIFRHRFLDWLGLRQVEELLIQRRLRGAAAGENESDNRQPDTQGRVHAARLTVNAGVSTPRTAAHSAVTAL